MKDLHGTATGVVAAGMGDCLTFLAAVDRYPSWYPEVVRAVDVLERDQGGQPTRVRTQLHLEEGPLVKDFDLVMAVVVQPPDTVRLDRTSDKPSATVFAVGWHLQAGQSTRITVRLDASLQVPRFLPVGGLGDSIARGFLAAASRALAAEYPA